MDGKSFTLGVQVNLPSLHLSIWEQLVFLHFLLLLLWHARCKHGQILQVWRKLVLHQDSLIKGGISHHDLGWICALTFQSASRYQVSPWHFSCMSRKILNRRIAQGIVRSEYQRTCYPINNRLMMVEAPHKGISHQGCKLAYELWYRLYHHHNQGPSLRYLSPFVL